MAEKSLHAQKVALWEIIRGIIDSDDIDYQRVGEDLITLLSHPDFPLSAVAVLPEIFHTFSRELGRLRKQCDKLAQACDKAVQEVGRLSEDCKRLLSRLHAMERLNRHRK